MELNRIYHEDCLETMSRMESGSVDLILTDPPYGISFMGQAWDYELPKTEIWEECLRVLKAGGYLLSFSSARTYHRLVTRIEDAGFEIRDQIMWLYGSGFPKSKAQIKPMHEPICVARKSGDILPLNIEEARIDTNWETDAAKRKNGKKPSQTKNTYGKDTRQELWYQTKKRYPGNVIIDEQMAMLIDAQSGTSGGDKRATKIGRSSKRNIYGKFRITDTPVYNDVGGASRFFYVAKASPSERDGIKHPTVKPINLIKQLMSIYSSEGQIVFDPFCGSGTTAICAFMKKRQFICSESDGDNYREAIARYKREEEGGGALALQHNAS